MESIPAEPERDFPSLYNDQGLRKFELASIKDIGEGINRLGGWWRRAAGWWLRMKRLEPLPAHPEAVPCVSCGETVGKYALTCPHCGTNYANRLWWLWMKWVIRAVVVILIVIGLGALFKDCSRSSAHEVEAPPYHGPNAEEGGN